MYLLGLPLKNRLWGIVGLLCLGVAAYLISLQSTAWVFLGLLVAGWGFAISRRQTTDRPLQRLLVSQVAESRSAAHIDLSVWVDQVLEHPAAVAAFDRLKKLGRIAPDVTGEAWREAVFRRFQARRNLQPQVKAWNINFEVRAGQLWKNGEYKRGQFIEDELLIPDDAMKHVATEVEYLSGLRPHGDDRDYEGVKLRVLVLNGVLKVQIGQFNRDTAAHTDGSGYAAWETITTFPLLLNAKDHWLPPRFLLLDYFTDPVHSGDLKGSKKAFAQRVDEYYRVLATRGEYGENALFARHDVALKAWLKNEDYTKNEFAEGDFGNRYVWLRFWAFNCNSDFYTYLTDRGRDSYMA